MNTYKFGNAALQFTTRVVEEPLDVDPLLLESTFLKFQEAVQREVTRRFYVPSAMFERAPVDGNTIDLAPEDVREVLDAPQIPSPTKPEE